MAEHRIYASIVAAVRAGTLREPFSVADFRHACPEFADRTYGVFLNKHRAGNTGGDSELFEKLPTGKYKLLRPVRYGL